MQIKTFIIPCVGAEATEAELNKFLRSQRILVVDRHFSESIGGWAVMVQYQDGEATRSSAFETKDAKDYSKELSPPEYERFILLKKARTELSKANNCPAYLILTNEEIAQLSKFEKITLDLLKAGVQGIPQRRLNDHGQAIIQLLDKYKKEDGKQAAAPSAPLKPLSENAEDRIFDGEDLPFG